MKNLIFFIVFLLNSLFLFGQSEKTIIKSFNLNTNNVLLELDCPKTISSWDKPYVKVELIVTANFKTEFMDVLVKNGRYKFESIYENGKLIVTLPSLKNKMKIGDVDLEEKFKLKIWLPDNSQPKENISL